MGKYYAELGEIVTCTNGHHICDFIVNIPRDAIQNLPQQLGNWQQEEPIVGQFPIPKCAKCGAAFYDGLRFHVGNAWRD